MIYLRSADGLDSLSLAHLRAASLTEMGLLPPTHRDGFVARAAGELNALFRTGRIAVWIACDDERVVAAACAVFYDRLPYPDGSRHAEVCGVYVRPLYRKRGFASELVREVVAAARAAGARKTFLRPSKSAKSLYARLGFADTELMVFTEAPQAARRSDSAFAALPH